MLKTRLLTAIVLIFLFLAAVVWLPDMAWAGLTLGIILIGAWEWTGFMQTTAAGRRLYVGLTALYGVGLLVALHMGYTQPMEYSLFWGVLLSIVFWVIIAPVWLVLRSKVQNVFFLGAIGWVVLLPTWFALMMLKISGLLMLVNLEGLGIQLLLGIIVVIWIADSAAYFFGKRFGKHKLAPAISPGKTWEGVLGAWLAVSLYGAILCFAFNLDLWLIVALWGVTVLSIMGDLLESLFKRQSGLKDSGNILPGHGGMLDRIDGLTSSLPLAAFFIYFPLYYEVLLGYV